MEAMLALHNLENAIRKLREDHLEIFGESSAPIVTMYPPIQRPYSMLVRVRLEWRHRDVWVYVKAPFRIDDEKKCKALRGEYLQLKWYYQRLPVESGYTVVRPLRLYEEYNALVTEEAVGTVLDLMLRQYGKIFDSSVDKLGRHFRRCGEWLKDFQALSVPPFCRPYRADEAAEFVKGQLRMCAEDGLLEKGLLSAISSFLEEVARHPKLMDYPVVPMHSDFIPSNIIVSDERTSLLDFVDCWSGPACRDVITFLTTLDGVLVNPWFRPEMIDMLKSEFLKGYSCKWNEGNDLVCSLFEIREILGKILQLSKRLDGIRARFVFQRMRRRLSKRLSNIVIY